VDRDDSVTNHDAPLLRREIQLRPLLRSAGRYIVDHPAAMLLAMTLLSALLHLQLFRGTVNHFTYDSPQYLAGARSLASGDGFLDEAGKPEARRTPGYPLLLAIVMRFGGGVREIIAVQHLVALFLPALVYALAMQLTTSRSTALVAALIVALDPGHLIMANLIMTELPTSFLLLALSAALFAAQERSSPALIVLSGLIAGYSALVKPVALYLFLPLAFWLFFTLRRQRIAFVALFLAASLALPLGWIARNHRVTGVASMSSISGEIVYYFRAAGAVVFDRVGFEYSPIPLFGEDGFRYQFYRVVQNEFAARGKAALEKHYGRPVAELSEIERSTYLGQQAWRIIAEHPRGFLYMTINGAIHMVFDEAWEYSSAAVGGDLRIVSLWLMLAVNIVFFPLSIAGFVRLKRAGRGAAIMLLTIIILYFVAMHAGPEHERWRYRIPLIPLYAVLIAAGVTSALPRVPRASRPPHAA
jgi:4-amino-4-deoxy-L-arabinose transferase-like glycosyltransferase